ncbi:MAG TPA: PqiC family protein [Aliidongia sp.]|uniref:PqiC family protein n=1 Tax=Aliidongia sp. TaxID=1914230 RepID=UPI002DDD38D8|nr:PqiC family protein [Aliidongia sp.]HEV2674694.1 PqiC family protein [Aliidongia sp.]
MHARRLAAVGFTALLAACASAPTRFHTLDPVASASPPAGRLSAVPVRLDSVTVPPELDRPQIVRRAGPGRLDMADDDRWAGALDELARGALAADLAQRLPPGATVRQDDPAPPRSLHKLDVVIERFEGTMAGPVTLVARWTLLGEGAEQALARHEEHIEVPASGDIDGTVTAMSAALGILADRIAAQVR